MAIFFISDLHIGHANVIRFDNRPFCSLKDFNTKIIENWNNAVSPDDEVYILGDFGWKNTMALDVIKQLKGKKHLILGNHDHLINSELKQYFESIQDYKVIVTDNQCIVLSHYPIAFWYGQHKYTILLYGHLHNTVEEDIFRDFVNELTEKGIPAECYNVGCMMPYMNYTPHTLEEIRNGFTQLKNIN
ncbi:MAG: metallophosphoesterase family protein [Oscillospiraceae bacterium]|nr:metallophosphoesterase family protein [Oscillospiraceae bacterium]